MSLHDPARRPWGTARGARIISMSAWMLVAVCAALTALWWVGMLSGHRSLLTPSIIAFNISIFAGIGAMFVDLGTAARRGEEHSASLPRLPGSWLTGAGIGASAAVALGPASSLSVLPWGVLLLVGGVALFISPNLLAAYRARRAQRHSQIRTTGIRTRATVTEVRTFYREHLPHYRVTLRFTDEQGAQRWFTQTAPAGARKVSKGRNLPLHYDPANPRRKRTLVVDWPTWV